MQTPSGKSSTRLTSLALSTSPRRAHRQDCGEAQLSRPVSRRFRPESIGRIQPQAHPLLHVRRSGQRSHPALLPQARRRLLHSSGLEVDASRGDSDFPKRHRYGSYSNASWARAHPPGCPHDNPTSYGFPKTVTATDGRAPAPPSNVSDVQNRMELRLMVVRLLLGTHHDFGSPRPHVAHSQ